jgi:hypothetical protein
MKQYSNKQWLILILSLMIIIDDINALRIRMPSLRISSTFSRKSQTIKKKNHAMEIPDERISLKVHPSGQKDDL